jgi:hypothetical protein
MNRSKKIRLIFFELRRALGDQLGTRELLNAAKSLVDLQGDNWTHEPTFELRQGRTPFDHIELDIAMSDGGWQVYRREREIVSFAGSDERFEPRRFITASDIVEELDAWQN